MAANSFRRLVASGVGVAAAASAAYLIIPFEGSVRDAQGNHRVYLDAVGIPTACYGQTGYDHRGNTIRLGMTYTEEECVDMLKNTVKDFERRVDSMVQVPYSSPYQKAALISFSYNVGINAFQNSTLLRRLNAMDYTYACDELSRWVYAQKQKLNGLVRRRAEERLWCLGEVPYEVRQQITPVDMTAALVKETTPTTINLDVQNTSEAIKEEGLTEVIENPIKECKWTSRLAKAMFCRG